MRFGMPFSLVCDKDPYFSSTSVMQWDFEWNVTLNFSSNYHPQENGVAE